MTVTHDVAVLSDKSPLEHEHRIAFRQALPNGVTDIKDVKGTILLCHGFPQSSYQFRKVVGPIADATGYLCIAPDMRGHGFSSKPLDGPEGFTKTLISQDFHEVITKHLKLGDKPIHVVGHDVGAMVAVRYAMQFNPKSLMFGEACGPSIQLYSEG
jgi:pimeloyl-ACP methyl ester carboxylesterase